MSINLANFDYDTRKFDQLPESDDDARRKSDEKTDWTRREPEKPSDQEIEQSAPRPAERSGGSFAGTLGEAEVKAGMEADLASSDATECFGGLLFRSLNAHQGEVVAHAIGDVARSEAQKLVSDWYYRVTTNHPNMFLIYDHSKPLKKTVVFTFRLPAGYRSLRELMDNPKARNYGLTLFRKLINFLADYEEATRKEGKYRPLCCLSLDTVFMHETENDIRVLPLIARNGNFPAYYPGEAGAKTADITTDMYTAALTALQFMSGCEMETEEKQMADCTGIPGMDNCLRVFQSRRPALREVQTLLGSRSADDSEKLRFDKGPNGEPLNQEKKWISVDEILKRLLGKEQETATSRLLDEDEESR